MTVTPGEAGGGAGYNLPMTRDAPTEKPQDKDLQDHTFGLTAAAEQERAERSGDGSGAESRPEPHAGGKA